MSVIANYIKNGLNYAAITGGITAAIAGLGAIGGGAADAMGALQKALGSLQQPSLCFIPIKSEILTERCQTDIGNTMIITQAEQKKEYVTDNAAPHPRVWNGKGYIECMAPIIESGLMIKPTLLVQQAILEAAADSRQPVKFKTDTGEVFDVLVQDLQITSLPKGTNAKMITYVVQEVKMLENATTAGEAASSLGKAAAASIPVRAAVNLGKNKLIGAGVTSGVAGLMAVMK